MSWHKLTSVRYVLGTSLILLGFILDSNSNLWLLQSGWLEIYIHLPGLCGCLGSLIILLLLLRDIWVIPRLLLPSLSLTLIPELTKALDSMKTEFLQKNAESSQSVSICTEDNVLLDGVTWKNNSSETASKRWIVWFNANGFLYETILEFLQRYARSIDASFLAFSYRGVARSQHVLPFEFRDLVLDGQAAVDWLTRSESIDASQILMHGHSLGGAVATAVRLTRHPQGPLINDRSFSSLFAVTRALFLKHNPAFATVLGYGLGIILSFLFVFTFDLSLLYSFLFILVGVPATPRLCSRFPILLEYFVRLFFVLIGWNVNVTASWQSMKSQRTLVIYHPDDAIIRRSTSFSRSLASLPIPKSSYLLFELPSQQNVDGHNSLLDAFGTTTWLSVTQTIRRLLAANTDSSYDDEHIFDSSSSSYKDSGKQENRQRRLSEAARHQHLNGSRK